MQAVTATLKQATTGGSIEWSRLKEAPLKWLTRLFGCWHREMSRPFTLRAESYRACLECGAHREFNTQVWEMTGPYYYERAAKAAELYSDSNVAVRLARPNRAPRRALRAA